MVNEVGNDGFVFKPSILNGQEVSEGRVLVIAQQKSLSNGNGGL